MGGFIPGPVSAGNLIAYASVDSDGNLQAGSVGFDSALLAGVGDYQVDLTAGFFSTIIGAWVNALSLRIGSPLSVSNPTINVQIINPNTGSNSNGAFTLWVMGT